jgi:hypothetical protein
VAALEGGTGALAVASGQAAETLWSEVNREQGQFKITFIFDFIELNLDKTAWDYLS